VQVAAQLARRTPFFYGWVILFAAGTSNFVRNAVASLTLAVFIYPITQELGWSRTLIAGAVSVGGLAASGLSPLVGWLSDRYGVRVVLTASVFILGLATVSLSWATAPIAFYLAYATGRVIFSSPIQIGSSVVVSRWFVRRRGRAAGILSMAHSGGMVTFPLIASLVIQSRGWQDAWVVLGVLVWIIALGPVGLLIIQRPEDVGLKPDGGDTANTKSATSAGAPQAEPTWTLREAIHTPALWLLAASTGALFLVHAGTNTHLGAYFRDQGLSATIAAAAISLNAVFTGVGSIVWGWMLEKTPVRYVFSAVAIVIAIAAGLFIMADTTAEAFLFSSLFGFGLGGMLVVPPVAYADYFGRRSLGAIRGVTEPFTSLGQAIGAVASGAVFDATGSYHMAFLAFAALGAATMVTLMLAKPPLRARG
jgi:OFA family oxalate/formate antiporter-like MFS transporter